jgi:hypothetical protein
MSSSTVSEVHQIIHKLDAAVREALKGGVIEEEMKKLHPQIVSIRISVQFQR